MDTDGIEARLAQLEEHVQELSNRLTTLAVCKLADPRYPYFECQRKVRRRGDCRARPHEGPASVSAGVARRRQEADVPRD